MKTPIYGFCIGMYFDAETMRQRWAVIGPNDVWYFAKRYGIKSARQLCKRLNKVEGK